DTAPFLHQYVFVGGSALAIHLSHRKSEDLDFFSWDAKAFDSGRLQQQLGRWQSKEIINLSDQQIDLLLDGVKVTFFNAGWPLLKPTSPDRFNLATLESLAAMKAHTLFVRAKYRDYYDLYFLVRELGLETVFVMAKKL